MPRTTQSVLTTQGVLTVQGVQGVLAHSKFHCEPKWEAVRVSYCPEFSTYMVVVVVVVVLLLASGDNLYVCTYSIHIEMRTIGIPS